MAFNLFVMFYSEENGLAQLLNLEGLVQEGLGEFRMIAFHNTCPVVATGQDHRDAGGKLAQGYQRVPPSILGMVRSSQPE
ncbi:MAG: hypothetical protein NT154_25400 [Verrucomicrobia bacterium]|nr:hypothetical protein [Verrucomicrobiota bacterium]